MMNRFFKRATALALTLLFIAALAPAALAALADITVSYTDAGSVQGYAKVQVAIDNNGATDIALTSIACASNSLGDEAVTYSTPVDILAGGSWDSIITLKVNDSVSGNVRLQLLFTFSDGTTKTATGEVNLQAAVFENPIDTEDTTKPAVMLSAVDKDKMIVLTPSGNAGDTLRVRIPLLVTAASVSSITIAPVLSTSLDEFPFNISKLDYTLSYPNLAKQGAIIEFQYDLTLSEMVTAGVKKVTFNVDCKRDWGASTATQKIELYVNVIKGYTAPTDKPDGAETISQPKLILDGYTFSTDKIYAGEEFDVSFTLRNTSDKEAVQNIQISISEPTDTGKLMPANGGSNTLYIDRIGKEDSHTVTLSMTSAADTDPKAYKLLLDLNYEGASNVVNYKAAETISLTILQRIRLKFDDPQFYDDFYTGQSTAAYFAMYNMGKSSIYNCMVAVEGDGLSLEETYFGGTISAGGTMRADFNIIAETPGDIEGAIVITYEDSLGEQMEERLPISIFVNDTTMEEDPGMMDPMLGGDPMYDPSIDMMGGGASAGFPLWAWIAIGAAVVGGAVTLIVILKKKRSKELEDV